MIRADHKKYAQILFDFYLKRLIKKTFRDFLLLEAFPKIDQSKSLVVTPNHFSWWDGFFIYWLLKKALDRKIHIMMLEDQLKRYWFFQKLGCYSIDLGNKQSTITSLRYTLEILKDPKNVVVIFPQGEIQPYEKRPVEIREGLNFLTKSSDSDFLILPIGFKIHYTNEKNPIVFCRAGELINSSEIKDGKVSLLRKFTENLDLLDSNYSKSKTQSLF